MKLNHSIKKASVERDIFAAFARRLGEQEFWTSIESKGPPKPDLICQHRTFGAIAFELVAITDPQLAEINAGRKRYCGQGLWTEDPTQRIIRKKLSRKYESEHPIELLIYSDSLVITPDAIIMETAANWLGSKEHPFRRAWFMGESETCKIWQNDA